MADWTWLEGKEFDETFKNIPIETRENEVEYRYTRLDQIAQRISDVKQQREEAAWVRQARYEEDADDYDYGVAFESEEDERRAIEEHELEEHIKHAKADAELNCLYEEMASLGARMCRPYEAWNEDEHYMEYMERDRD